MHISHLHNKMYKIIKKCHFSLLNYLKVLYNKAYIFTSEVKGSFLMEVSKIRVRIGGADYHLTTDGDVTYLRNIAGEVDSVMTSIMKESYRISTAQAAVLTSLQFADEMHKAEDKSLTIRKEIQAYMEDASKAKTDAEIARREVERLNKEIASLKNELSRYKYE